MGQAVHFDNGTLTNRASWLMKRYGRAATGLF
jgi:hypothetical protein